MIKVNFSEIISLGSFIESGAGLSPIKAKRVIEGCIFILQGKSTDDSKFVECLINKPTVTHSDIRLVLTLDLEDIPLYMASGNKVMQSICRWRLHICK